MEEEAEPGKILPPINRILLTVCKGRGNPCMHKLGKQTGPKIEGENF